MAVSTKMAAGFDVASNNKSDKRARASDNNCCTDSKGSSAAGLEVEMLLDVAFL